MTDTACHCIPLSLFLFLGDIQLVPFIRFTHVYHPMPSFSCERTSVSHDGALLVIISIDGRWRIIIMYVCSPVGFVYLER